jgi:molybdenum cofactor synthesis domain-containing protein
LSWTQTPYVSVQAALRRLNAEVQVKGKVESAKVTDCYGRVLAQDVYATGDIPLRDSSHMDGYALRANDAKDASPNKKIKLRLEKSVTLGVHPDFALRPGEASRITTGGFLPKGADSVVPLEEVREAASFIELKTPVSRGSFVHPAGADLRKGTKVFLKGVQLRAQDIGLLIAMRLVQLKVFRKPRVGIIPTGSELTDDFSSAKDGRVPNTHSHILSEIVQAAGALAHDLGVVPDQLTKLTYALRQAAESSDLILTIGGSSVGGHDLIESAIASMASSHVLAHGVRLDRGRVCGAAIVAGKPVIILPGPAQGMLNAFFVFAYPLIRSLSGIRLKDSGALTASLTKDWKARKRFPHFTKIVYVKLSERGGDLKASPVTGETERMMVLREADGLVIVPEQTTNIRAGEKVRVHLLSGFSYVGSTFPV